MSPSDQPPRWPWLQFPLLQPFAFHASLQKCRLAPMVAYKRVPAHPHHRHQQQQQQQQHQLPAVLARQIRNT